ncbi:Cytochrome b-c1 complex subunit 2-like protein [Leptotrombidium deliense]|uniref:Cytochrome b-c1 complex subunit 2-like protein n=1 Tax=Leptotrombidium deliense TaxID=299467 RepID=A0A443SDQ6_9ACAR|nr:Cytochrome b-c1 complex subunit 2-like protein [Leptotrombidium deliense]
MSAKLHKISGLLNCSKRAFSAKAAPKIADRQQTTRVVKQTKLANGLLVVAVENDAPISRIGVYIRAGARFETSENLGITHCLRNCAGLSTTNSTIFGITRNVEHVGGFLTATNTREDMVYKLGNIRDFTSQNLGYLADTVTRPAFKPWEIKDFKYRMEMDCERFKLNREAQLIESLHKVSFRGGLSNSLYTPDFKLGTHDHNTLMEYVMSNYLSSRMVVVGIGIDCGTLVDYVERNFTMNSGESKPISPSKFISGEIRVDDDSDICLAGIVTEGVSVKNSKDMVSLCLFQHILGCGPRMKYNEGVSILSKAAKQASEKPSTVTALNISYSDSGLFGVTVAGHANDMDKLLKAVVGKMKEVSKSLKEEDLQKAKLSLKASWHMALESDDTLLDEIGYQALNFGEALNLHDMEAAVDGITLKDLSAVTSKVMKGKPSMASIGKLHNTPYLEDIVSM